MQIVIDIPESVYNYIMLIGSISTLDTQLVANTILDGTPLPKGHGDLKDANALKHKIQSANDNIMEEDWDTLYDNVISDIDNAPTIIEADKRGD